MAEASDFGSFGRSFEVRVDELAAEMRDAYDISVRLRGQMPDATSSG